MRVSEAVIAAAPRIAHHPHARADTFFVSVVIPAYNAADVLPLCLASVLRQDYPGFEVIVVNDGSTDRTAAWLSTIKDPRLRVLHHRRNLGLAASLNDGIRHAEGDLVLILHADCELMSGDYLRQAAAHFLDPRVTWITGAHESLGLAGGNLFERIFAALRLQTGRRQPAGVVPVTFAEGKCDMIRRRALDEVGGVPKETKWSGEDQLLSYALRGKGHPILKDGALVVLQHCGPRPLLQSLFFNLRKEFVHGKTQAWINLRYFSTVLSDILTHKHFMVDRTRAALSRLLFGGSIVALLAILVVRPSPVVLVLLAVIVLACIGDNIRRARKAALRLTPAAACATGLVGIAVSVAYLWGMLWGTAVVALQAGRPARPL